eukprot:SAG31_NODE_4144_length_3504_cov_7.703276_4_plen_170_part_00
MGAQQGSAAKQGLTLPWGLAGRPTYGTGGRELRWFGKFEGSSFEPRDAQQQQQLLNLVLEPARPPPSEEQQSPESVPARRGRGGGGEATGCSGRGDGGGVLLVLARRTGTTMDSSTNIKLATNYGSPYVNTLYAAARKFDFRRRDGATCELRVSTHGVQLCTKLYRYRY